MLGSAIGALSGRLDAKFLTAFWLPAFVAVLGGCCILAAGVGLQHVDAWISGLDAVEQSLATLLILLAITMLAFVFRALTRPIAAVFAGDALPRVVADWSTRGQLRTKRKAAQLLNVATAAADAASAAGQAEVRFSQVFPRDDGDARPTRFGNILASAAEHPRIAYAMAGTLWWPRLAPLVPAHFEEALSGAQAPMMGLLNLSVVFVALGLLGGATLVLAGSLGVAAVTLIGGWVLSWLCYRAAASQATEVGSQLRVAFDLYRTDLLTQLGQEPPTDLPAERALWQRLTAELLGLPESTPSVSSDDDAAASDRAHSSRHDPNEPAAGQRADP